MLVQCLYAGAQLDDSTVYQCFLQNKQKPGESAWTLSLP